MHDFVCFNVNMFKRNPQGHEKLVAVSSQGKEWTDGGQGGGGDFYSMIFLFYF